MVRGQMPINHPETNSMTVYAAPGAAGAKITYKPRYDNFIGGKFVPPVKGQYFDVISPVNGKAYTQAARSTAEDIELALDAAHAAADAWGKTDAATRANLLLKIANRIEENLERLAYAETVDNGKAIRETLNADIPPRCSRRCWRARLPARARNPRSSGSGPP
jgi:aldehyde dehydrogenase